MTDKSRGRRGKSTEKEVEAVLEAWSEMMGREFHRMPDARSAAGRLAAQPADFLISTITNGAAFLEAKETAHEFRIARDKISQLGKLRLFAAAGTPFAVVVNHTTSKLWRCVPGDWFGPEDTPPSWDLSPLPTYTSCEDALAATGWFS